MKTNCQSSGSYLGAMKLCLAIVVCLCATGRNPVDAAMCTMANRNCVATNFTMATCSQTTMICDCVSGYVAIPTGCAKKLAQPMVTKDPSYTNEFSPSTIPTPLTCNATDAEGVTYQWSVNGTAIPGATSMQYGVTGTSSGGTYTCTITAGTDTATSPGVILTPVGPLGPAVAPTVTNQPQYAAPGATLDVKCSNIPIGATYKFKVDSGNPTTTVTYNNSSMNIVCVLDPMGSFTMNIMSAPTPLTTQNAADITGAMISPTGPLTYKTGTPVIVTCLTMPPAQYMTVGTKTITYTFQDSANPNAMAVTNQYTVPGTAGTHSITCTASYAGMAGKVSAAATLMFSDTYVQTPNLTSSNGGQPVITNSSLSLMCGSRQATTGGVSYMWYKDGAAISRQRDSIIQYGSFQKTDAGRFYCTAMKGTYMVNSNEITIMSGADGLRVLSSAALLVLVALTSSRIF